jgi:hypothetical protein
MKPLLMRYFEKFDIPDPYDWEINTGERTELLADMTES